MVNVTPIDLNEYIPITPQLADILGIATRSGEAKMGIIVDKLAEELGRNSQFFGPEACDCVVALATELGDVLREGPGTWVDDLEQDRPGRLARAATNDIGLYQAVEAAHQFGWRRLKGSTSVRTVDDFLPATVEMLVAELSPTIRQMIDRWRDQGLWQPQVKRGLVTSRKASELEAS